MPCPVSCFQLLEINTLLTDEFELIDWRRFLLSATLPWPLPSLSQLLYLLKQFKEADTDDTGYINEDQYLQVRIYPEPRFHTNLNYVCVTYNMSNPVLFVCEKNKHIMYRYKRSQKLVSWIG